MPEAPEAPRDQEKSEDNKPEAPTTMTLKIGSYNIANGSYVSHNLQKIADDILDLDLDVVGLQEVDYLSGRSKYLDTMRVLAELTGYQYYYFSEAIDLPTNYGGKYGTGILSKYPIVCEKTRLLPSGDREQRVLGEVIIKVGGTDIHFFNAHLSWEEDGIRQGQFVAIDKVISEYDYCILTGDFNIKALSELASLTTLTGASNADNPMATYWREETPLWPTKCLDNVMYSEKFTLTACGVWDDRKNSDHYLLWAELAFDLK
jgi:endonuclease/exonuclease/phosphatase family metal-dependent hydrolase